MGEAAVVLGPTRIEMVNQVLSRLAIKTIQVLIGKGSQQQFRLIEPTGTGRGIHGSQARMGGEVSFPVVVNMGAAVVHNQMQASRAAVLARHLAHAPQEVIVVVFVHTPAVHRAVVDVEGHHQRYRAMPLILKLTPFYLAQLQHLARDRPRQGLDIGFLVQTEHDFPALMKPPHPLIAP
jgi:hypothetical protein